MSDTIKISKLLSGLLDATRRGRLEWEDTAYEAEFRVLTDNAMIRLGPGFDDEERQPTYTIVLMDPKGRIADEYKVVAEGDEGQGAPSDYATADLLYNLARRRARRADELLDRAISDLEARRS